jgi:prepilin-type N-terminal cleavage/methylation domain-containing protein
MSAGAPRVSRAGARRTRQAFTLVELLVVIGIIAVLLGILLPALGRAREAGNTIKCAANLRSIGQGIAIYLAEYKGHFPPAYLYVGQSVKQGDGLLTDDSKGYIHWSSYLYKGVPGAHDDPSLYQSTVGWEQFMCPSLDDGGLPPTNTFAANVTAGLQQDAAGVIDQQAPRCAYTVNEAICPRNKFYAGFQGAARPYQFVQQSSIKNASDTILATEWTQTGNAVSGAGRSGGGVVSKSHRPIHGFKRVSGGHELYSIAAGGGFRSGGTAKIARVPLAEADIEPTADGSPLTLVGRNHGKTKPKGYDDRRTNFLSVDWHVETKQLRDTVAPHFQWGDSVYSLNPGDDIQK